MVVEALLVLLLRGGREHTHRARHATQLPPVGGPWLGDRSLVDETFGILILVAWRSLCVVLGNILALSVFHGQGGLVHGSAGGRLLHNLRSPLGHLCGLVARPLLLVDGVKVKCDSAVADVHGGVLCM